jgi:integrase
MNHTLDHIDCPACAQEQREAMRGDSLADLTLAKASALWLEEKKMFLRTRTLKDYQQYFRAVVQFLGELPLKDVHIGHIRAYQKWRTENGPPRQDRVTEKVRGRPAGAGPTRINNEVRVLGQLMTEAHLWQKIRPFHKPLPEPIEGPGVAITEERAREMFRIAAKNKKWEVAVWIALLQVNTTMGPGEVTHLQLADIDLQDGKLVVRRGLKNRFRAREIDLVPTAAFAVRKLLERAHRLGCTEPTHYLLPRRRHGKGTLAFDPNLPQESWRSAWNGMRKAAGMPTLRPYDLRHSAITWLLGHPSVPPQVVQEIAGWANLKMAKRYSHQNRAAKKAALSAAMGQLDLFANEDKKPPVNILEELQVEIKKLQ